MKKILIVALFMILLSFIMGAYLYPLMPDSMASHWNIKGEVDSYMSKNLGLFLMPAIGLGILIMFMLIPWIDPLKRNIEMFRKHYDMFIFILITFLFYIHILTVLWNAGYRFSMTQMIAPGLAILFYYVGVLVGRAKRNWFVGIRTPWTLSSDVVWEKTHKVGGILFRMAAVVVVLAMFLPQYAFYLILAPIIGVAIATIIYSYVEYRKLKG